eukprot:4169477-Prymnesium_polylepis.1
MTLLLTPSSVDWSLPSATTAQSLDLLPMSPMQRCRMCVAELGQEFASALEALSLPQHELRSILIYMIARKARVAVCTPHRNGPCEMWVSISSRATKASGARLRSHYRAHSPNLTQASPLAVYNLPTTTQSSIPFPVACRVWRRSWHPAATTS